MATKTATLVVAVSGGVDSVVLLDKLAAGDNELVVAHFDHGTRPDSADDAAFVGTLAKKYNLPFETTREELGADVSEDRARQRRYHFLRMVAKKHHAVIATAHHGDDVVETIAINLTRGTGWRGLAVLDSDIMRPLLHYTKKELLDYAKQHNLTWHDDSTNTSDTYLRNRLRQKIATTLDDDHKFQLLALRDTQVSLKRAIDQITSSMASEIAEYSRYFFTAIDEQTADELLRAICQQRIGVSPTRPQRTRALLAIKTAQAGTTHQIATGMQLVVTKQLFTVQIKK